jgi:lipopolysaccharide transport system ATP-binding protein
MSNTVISIESVSKRYQLGSIGTGTLKGDFIRWRALRRGKPDPFQVIGEENPHHHGKSIWALKDVDLKVQEGEALGIIGRNGSGKSTLLKILSEVTAPTKGEVRIKGRIASLLEVGTGFHPDLTGRENVFLNGAILGMNRQEVRQKFDEIIDFSGIETFVDTPVKRYSSGMFVRLAFAVAAHLDPDILVVDEVLAVGDAEFQRKCLGKMGRVAGEGRTVLFVSHSMMAVQTLCQSAVWLDKGKVKDYGFISQIVANYIRSGLPEEKTNERVWMDIHNAPGNENVRIHCISVQPENGKPGDKINIKTPLRVEVDYWNLLPGVHLHPTLQFFTDQGYLAFSTSAKISGNAEVTEYSQAGLYRSVCHIPGNLLNSGPHRVNLQLNRDHSASTYQMNEAIGFEVDDDPELKDLRYNFEPGVLHPLLPWETKYIGEDSKH